jgi:sugar diacid utilization regulator
MLDELVNKACSDIDRNDLKNTLKDYVRFNGDVKAVADNNHQHGNTIRYRISKVKNMWNCKSELEFHAQITFYIRIGQILELLV